MNNNKNNKNNEYTTTSKQNRTNKPFENIRYRLMWWIAPVNRDNIRNALTDEVDTWDGSQYDNVRMIGNLLYLWDDEYFNTETRHQNGEGDG